MATNEEWWEYFNELQEKLKKVQESDLPDDIKEKLTDMLQDMETTAQRTDSRQVGRKNLLTAEQKALIAETEALIAQGDRMMEEDVSDIREKLGNLPEIINLSAVARLCFGKSRTWLYQRINGNKVNGKPAYFTRAERKQLLEFLHKLGNDLLAVKLV